MEEHFKRALLYVRENKNWYADEESAALRRIACYRCSLDFAAPSISQSIVDLMNEYGYDNGLPENWWIDFGCTDDIFFKIGD